MQKLDFYLLPFGRYLEMKTSEWKIGKFRIRPSRVHLLSQPISLIKKLIYTSVPKIFLYWNPKGFLFCLFFGWDMNDLVRYPFGTISNSFYSVLPLGFFMSFAPPTIFLSFPSLCSLFFINNQKNENYTIIPKEEKCKFSQLLWRELLRNLFQNFNC